MRLRTIPWSAPALLPAFLGCSVLVSPDESRLEPRDGGVEACQDDPVPPKIMFPVSNSGVLGVSPVWGEAVDCSGISSARVELLGGTSDTPVDTIGASMVGDRFTAVWDTTTWSGRSATLQATVRPVRTTVPEQTSQRVSVVVFGFDRPVPPASAGVPEGGWSFLDFDGDTDSDLFWGGALLRDDGSWPFTDVSGDAFADTCSTEGVTCRDGHLPWAFATVADLDGDGVLDLIGNTEGGPLFFVPGRLEASPASWKTGSPQVLVDTTGSGVPFHGAATVLVADVDLNGWLDVLMVGKCNHGHAKDSCGTGDFLTVLVMNQRDDPRAEPWRQLRPWESGLGVSWWDRYAAAGDLLGDDGFPDIVISRELGGPSLVYRNRGTEEGSRFVLVEGPYHLPSAFPVQLADVDRNGDLDLAFPTTAYGTLSALWRNDSDGLFTDITGSTGYVGGMLADINNDRFLDAGAMLGSPDGRFVQTGVLAGGIPLDIEPDPANPALDLVWGTGAETIARSDLIGTGRIVARVRLPTFLPGNRWGIGTRVRVVAEGDDPENPAPNGWGRSTAEIGSAWGSASMGFEAQFGTDRAATYDVYFRLPTLEPTVVICRGVRGVSVVTVGEDADGRPVCPGP